MKEQLYDEMVSEYSVGVTDDQFIPSKDVQGIVETLSGKTNLEDVNVDGVYIQQNSDGSYSMSLEKEQLGMELEINERINYSPENQRCVTNDNVADGRPPEGPTTDGNGKFLGGMR